MAKPSKEDFLAGTGRWNGNHRGVAYELSWHGMSGYSPEGTWCWYLFVNSEQFADEDWQKLRLSHEDKEFAGSFRRHFDYDNFPDLNAHGGWTFGEMDTYLGRDGKEHEQVKVGCDYAHLWDRESGFYQGRAEIQNDAERSVDLLLEQFPNMRQRCAYSGKWDSADQFYTARNGSLVHKSQQSKLPSDWDGWQPIETAA